MGFHKRFLSEDSIRAHAKNSFEDFEIYMTNADAYIISMGWANKIYHVFGSADEKGRKEIHKLIQNENK
jgi:hypothetical protein